MRELSYVPRFAVDSTGLGQLNESSKATIYNKVFSRQHGCSSRASKLAVRQHGTNKMNLSISHKEDRSRIEQTLFNFLKRLGLIVPFIFVVRVIQPLHQLVAFAIERANKID